jgi:hypothetical protein
MKAAQEQQQQALLMIEKDSEGFSPIRMPLEKVVPEPSLLVRTTRYKPNPRFVNCRIQRKSSLDSAYQTSSLASTLTTQEVY